MRRFVTSILTILIAISLITACGKKDKDKGKDKGKKGGTPAAKAGGGEKKGGGAKLDFTAPAFFKDYKSLDGPGVMEKYMNKRVTVNGAVKQLITEMDESVKVWLDAENNKWISLSFKDKGQGVKAKGAKKGDQLKANCDIGGADDNQVMLIDCDLK